MSKTLVLARRELAAYFISPVAYIVGVLFLWATAIVFFFGISFLDVEPIFEPGNEATLRPLFECMAAMMVVAVPLLTMRLLSEEFNSGTIETLMTAPVSDTAVVLGKFLGVLAFYAVLLATTVAFLILMVAYGQPDAGVAILGYVGMLLLGAAFIAVGLFASTLTRHQILAALVAVVILAVFAFGTKLLMLLTGPPWNELALKLNVMTYFKDFARGVLDTRGVVFFLSSTALFLFLSVKTLESRRWR